MWTKIYLGTLGVSTAVLAFLIYYSWSWLQSIGDPNASVANFSYYADLAWTALWVATIILLIVGNILLWMRSSLWAMWATFLYFSVFVAAGYFWLSPAFLTFQQHNGLTERTFTAGPLYGAVFIFLMAVIVFFDQFLVVRLHKKMYGEVQPLSESEDKADL